MVGVAYIEFGNRELARTAGYGCRRDAEERLSRARLRLEEQAAVVALGNEGSVDAFACGGEPLVELVGQLAAGAVLTGEDGEVDLRAPASVPGVEMALRAPRIGSRGLLRSCLLFGGEAAELAFRALSFGSGRGSLAFCLRMRGGVAAGAYDDARLAPRTRGLE